MPGISVPRRNGHADNRSDEGNAWQVSYSGGGVRFSPQQRHGAGNESLGPVAKAECEALECAAHGVEELPAAAGERGVIPGLEK
jgi:hypothetical protein